MNDWTCVRCGHAASRHAADVWDSPGPCRTAIERGTKLEFCGCPDPGEDPKVIAMRCRACEFADEAAFAGATHDLDRPPHVAWKEAQ